MEKYAVQITDEALADMGEIYSYIAKTLKSPENALGQYDRIASEILTLAQMPERYRIVEFEPEHSAGLRRMLVDNFSVFYIVRGKAVVVTNVLYSASDIEQRLKSIVNKQTRMRKRRGLMAPAFPRFPNELR